MLYSGHIGVTEKEIGNYYMLYWGHIGVMEKKLETTICCIGDILG